MKVATAALLAAIALPSAVVGQDTTRCYDRYKDTYCKNPDKIFRIIRGIDKDECKYLCTTYKGSKPGKPVCFGYEYNYDRERCELHQDDDMKKGGKADGIDCYIGYDCKGSLQYEATYTLYKDRTCKGPKKAPAPRKIYGVDKDECKRICTRDPTKENPECVGYEYYDARNQPCELFSEGPLEKGSKKDGYSCYVKD